MLESIYISWYDCGQHFSHPADFTGANDIVSSDPMSRVPLSEFSHKSHLSTRLQSSNVESIGVTGSLVVKRLGGWKNRPLEPHRVHWSACLAVK